MLNVGVTIRTETKVPATANNPGRWTTGTTTLVSRAHACGKSMLKAGACAKDTVKWANAGGRE